MLMELIRPEAVCEICWSRWLRRSPHSSSLGYCRDGGVAWRAKLSGEVIAIEATRDEYRELLAAELAAERLP